jgi:hypothetical protein
MPKEHPLENHPRHVGVGISINPGSPLHKAGESPPEPTVAMPLRVLMRILQAAKWKVVSQSDGMLLFLTPDEHNEEVLS